MIEDETPTEQALGTLFESIPDAIMIHDAETGEILAVNDQWWALFDASPATSHECSIADISVGTQPYTKSSYVDYVQQAADRDLQVFEWQADTHHWVEITMRQVTIEGKRQVCAVARDITERKQQEQELRSYEILFENTTDCIVEIRPTADGPRIQHVNSAFEEVFGYTEAEIKGAHLDDLIVPDERMDEATEINRRSAEGTKVTREVVRETKDGRREFLLRSANYQEEFFYVLYTDITERKQHERQLRETKRDLEQSNEKLERFAYIAAHDLQEPMRMVEAYVDLLEQELGDDLDDELREYMEFAVGGAERMQAMLDGLLQFCRVETAGDSFEPVDTCELLAEIQSDLHLRLSDDQVTIGVLPTVTADRDQLALVFQHLLTNALEHGSEDLHIEITATERDTVTEFAVADDGPGIPEYRQDDIFDLFDTDSEGTGIGLAVCQQIVHRHGGEIWVDSTEDEGTTFHFTIPDEPG